MIKRSSVARCVGVVFGVLLIVLAVFLAVTSMLFSFGSSAAPDIFGYNVYIVQDNDFYQLKAGTAAIAQKVWPDEVNNGELIIYNRFENGGAQLAKVNSSTLKEGVMSFDVETQSGENITISQSQLVARVNYCSDFWGAVIGFAMSPFGVMTIAVLPCLAIVAFEIVKFIFSRRPVPQVKTVKLQEESPVYTPAVKEEKKTENVRSKSAGKVAVPSLTDKVKVPHNQITDGSYSKTDDFTEHLRTKRNTAINPDEVKDRADFSAGAKRRLEKDRAEHKGKIADVKTESIKNEKVPLQKKNVEKPLTAMTEKADKAEISHGGSEPDISLVFSDDEDKRYDIDDILADIEKRHH